MFFTRKKSPNEEIKRAIEEETATPEISDAERSEDFPQPPPREAYIPETREEPIIRPQAMETAPLFVKVDKYKEILTSIQEMKIFISGTKQIFNVIYELESIRGDALKILKATLQRLEKSVAEIDTDLLRPRGFETSDITQGETEVTHIEGSLTELQKQLADLRRELQELK